MSESINLSSIGAFSYIWHKGIDSDQSYLIRFGKSMAAFLKALFCDYSVDKVDVAPLLDCDRHSASIFVKECKRKLGTFKIVIVNDPIGETQKNDVEEKKNAESAVQNNYYEQEPWQIKKNELKEESAKANVENVSVDDLESLMKDKHFKGSDSRFSTESLEQLKPEDCLRLLWKACELNRDVVALRLLTMENCNLSLSLSDNEKKNIWFLFLRNNRVIQMRSLLEAHTVDVNSPDNKGNTPLMIAANLGYTECLELLISKDATINACNEGKGNTALFMATLNGHEDCLRLLLEENAKVDKQNRRGVMPIHAAALRGHVGCLQMLLEAGANINEVNASGITPLHCAVIKGHQECLHLLLNMGADVNKFTDEGMTPLHIAAASGHVECVNVLIQKKAKEININAKNNKGNTPLYIAIEKNEISCLRALLTNPDTQLNLFNNKMLAPLSFALLNGRFECVDLLLNDKRTDVNQENEINMIPLHYAVMGGFLECLKKLLIKVDLNKVDVRNLDGYRPIDYAAEKDSEECLNELLTIKTIRDSVIKKVDYKKENLDRVSTSESEGEGDPLLSFTYSKKNKDVFENAPIYRAVKNDSLACLNVLLDVKGIDTHLRDSEGNTLLHCAVEHVSMKCLPVLLKKVKIDINITNNKGQTPLHVAVEKNFCLILPALLKEPGIDIDIKDNYGHRPIDYTDSSLWNMTRQRCERLLEEYKYKEKL